MQFVMARGALQKELAFVQGVVERKNTIPVLANILIESAGEEAIRISGTDLDVTIRCDADAEEISSQGISYRLHSFLSAMSGSTFVARRAGMLQAVSATTVSSAETNTNVSGSLGVTPNSKLRITRGMARAPAKPKTIPRKTTLTP